MNKVKEHQTICDELNKLYEAKNTDYGNSFSEQFKEYGMPSATMRFDDKIRRIKQLIKNDARVKGESLEDSLMDLANYSIMTLIESRNETDDPYANVEVVKIKKGIPSVIEIAGRKYVFFSEGKA